MLADRRRPGRARRARAPASTPRGCGTRPQSSRARSPCTRLADPLDALACFGGGEIAVLCGLALGAGEHGLGYVCDGLIATAAAAIAAELAPDLRPRLLAGHRSPEPAHGRLLARLELAPVLELGMRLGEASGAAAALAILRLAAAVARRDADLRRGRRDYEVAPRFVHCTMC